MKKLAFLCACIVFFSCTMSVLSSSAAVAEDLTLGGLVSEKTIEDETYSEEEPAVTDIPETTDPQIQVPEVSEPAVRFNIEYWLEFAKEYAHRKGLALEPSAVDCWDNPIRAGAHCIYLERDIQSRLNRYANDEDITDVWIWYESLGNDCYDIYIGYA